MTEEIKDEQNGQEDVQNGENQPEDQPKENEEEQPKSAEVKPGTEGLSKEEAQEVADGEAAPNYVPPPQKRKRRKKNKPPVGVGGLLDYARIKFSHGEYGVEEDAHGQYKIGEEELSFESWGAMIRTKEDGVYATQMAIPKQKVRKPQLIYDVDQQPNGKASKKKKVNSEKKDKDEGELSDSSDSSSSSSDSDSGTYRRKRAKKRKSTTDGMDAKEIFTKSYQYRNTIVQHLTLQQKMTFFELLRQQQ